MLPRSNQEPETTPAPIDRDERLGEAIEAYLELAEASGPTDPEEFAKTYPDLGEDLVSALEGLALVQGLVGEANGPGRRLEEGRRVAGYRIVRELGRGGMGIVYEAVHVGLDRPVALKVLGTQAAPDSSGRRRFLNEAKTAAGLHHTHIVPVFDVGQVGGLCYYAMQRIEGSGLDRVLRIMRRDRSVAAGSTLSSGSRKTGASPLPRSLAKARADDTFAVSGLGDDTVSWRGGVDVGGGSAWQRREPVDQPPTFTPPRGSAYYRWVADVGRQAAEALAHAHQRGVIHRDIKPSNLLVDARGMIWVADFGLARRLADPSQTQFDSMLGTPRYMSPEQARTGAIDGRADVYSLGATLYELITLRPPFDGQSAAELIDQIKTRDPSRPRKFDPKVPLDLETILLKALAKRPDDRYATADALAEDLARFLAHEPVKARRIGPVGWVIRFARRHPSLTAVSTTAAALVLSTATFAYKLVLDERDRANDAAVAAKQAQARTEVVNGMLKESDRDLKATMRDLKATMLASLEKHAANVLLSQDANRRSTGLELLRQAAAMKPDPAIRIRLRDQALAFLSMRDVEARAPIPTSGKPQHGLIFAANGKRIAALSDRGELGIWDVAGRELVDSTDLPIGPRRQANGPMRRARPGDLRIASAGEQLAVIAADGASVGFFDLASPDVPVEILPMKGHHVSALHVSADGRTPAHRRAPLLGEPDASDARRSAGARAPGRAPDLTLGPRPPRGPQGHADAPRLEAARPALQPGPAGPAAAAAAGHLARRVEDRRRPPVRDRDLPLGRRGPPPPPDRRPGQGHDPGAGAGRAPRRRGQRRRDRALGPLALRAEAAAKPGPEPELHLPAPIQPQERLDPRRRRDVRRRRALGPLHALDDRRPADPRRGRGPRLLPRRPDPGGGPAVEHQALVGRRAVRAARPARDGGIPQERGVRPRRPPGHRLDRGQLRPLTAPALGKARPMPRLGPGVGPGPAVVGRFRRPGAALHPRIRRDPLVPTDEPRARRQSRPAGRSMFAEVPGRPDDRTVPRPDPWRRGDGGRPPGPVPRPVRGPVPRRPDPGRRPDGRLPALAGRRPRGHRSSGPIDLRRGGRPRAPRRLRPARRPPLLPDQAGRRTHLPRPPGRSRPGQPPWSIAVKEATLLAISPDGAKLAVAEKSRSILLVDAARGTVRGSLSPPADDPVPAESLAFSPDGRTLAVGSRDQIRLWAVDGKPRPVVRLPGHRGNVRSMSFDAKGTRLAGADEKTIKVWDLASLRGELARLGLDW